MTSFVSCSVTINQQLIPRQKRTKTLMLSITRYLKIPLSKR
uniref:Uncharacterized protein n=1 Tax=Arundo donax TaxID=35708 RepID=A0A0A9F875_ARUDO